MKSLSSAARTLLLLILLPVLGNAAEIVSAFQGSEDLGEYSADYINYYYMREMGDKLEEASLAGRISSHLFVKPDEKSDFEVFSSFKLELEAAGFEILAAVDRTHRIEILARDFHGKLKNNMLQRRYTSATNSIGVTEGGRVSSQAQQYIAARKTIGQTNVLVSVTIGRNGRYVIDQLESVAMETGTVVLDLEALQSQMENEGRMAIYGISFDTGSAVIKPESTATLKVIVQFLQDNTDKRFYVVGHTDDSGQFDSNMALSRARAKATVAAILQELPGAEGRLQHDGVGPLSPVAVNTGEDGRKLNRRVELVEALN